MKKRDILLYLASFLFLALSFLMFILAFVYVNRGIYFIFSGATLVLFCVMNKLTEKKIRCEDGYNLLQAYFFYLRCEKQGIDVRATKIKEKEILVLADVASGYDYCKGFCESQLKELYRHGREAKILLGEKKGRKG